jgi:hypothetical protein
LPVIIDVVGDDGLDVVVHDLHIEAVHDADGGPEVEVGSGMTRPTYFEVRTTNNLVRVTYFSQVGASS